MAKYFLGKRTNLVFEPLYIEGVGTSIKEVIDFTTNFVDESELRDFLLQKGLISFWDDELAYVKENGSKGEYFYTSIPLGSRICTFLQKRFFDVERIKLYCFSNCFNSQLFKEMAAYYIRKQKIDQLLEQKLEEVFSHKIRLRVFLQHFSNLGDDLEVFVNRLVSGLFHLKEEELKEIFDELKRALFKDNDSLIKLFIYFKDSLDTINYIFFVERIIDVYNAIEQKKAKGLYSEEDTEYVKYYINQLLEMMIYRYDPIKKGFVSGPSGNLINERALADLGLFLVMFDDYEQQLYRSPDSSSVEATIEDFLEEEDFRRLHTSSEREGFHLRKKDKDQ